MAGVQYKPCNNHALRFDDFHLQNHKNEAIYSLIRIIRTLLFIKNNAYKRLDEPAFIGSVLGSNLVARNADTAGGGVKEETAAATSSPQPAPSPGPSKRT